MSSVSKLNKLADRFERKIIKFASDAEVDSTTITLTVRPVVNSFLETIGLKIFNDGPVKAMYNQIQKGLSGQSPRLEGTLMVGGQISLSATKINDKWKIDKLNISSSIDGDFSNNEVVKNAMKIAIEKINTALISILEKEFSRMTDTFEKTSPGSSKINVIEYPVTVKELTVST